MFRCMVMSQCDSLKCACTALYTTDVHEIVSISPHNLVYAILIWPPCTHIESCTSELPPETYQGYPIPTLYLLSFFLSLWSRKTFNQRAQIHPHYSLCDQKFTPIFFSHNIIAIANFCVPLPVYEQRKYMTITQFPIRKIDTHFSFRSHFVVIL